MKIPRLAALTLLSTLPLMAADFKDHLGIQLYSLRAQFKENATGALDLLKTYGVTEVETWSGTGLNQIACAAPGS